MAAYRATHEVFNQVPPLEDYNAYREDRPLREGVAREGGDWAEDRLIKLGGEVASARFQELARLANKHTPELQTHDRFGNRVDMVEFHPAYHELLGHAIASEAHAFPFNHPQPGAHVVRAALSYLYNHAEIGVCCPAFMTFASVPAMRRQPEIAEEWVPRVLSSDYDRRFRPAAEKTGVTIGMAMTEKQGGSDVRANTTRAEPLDAGGPGAEYELTGHKWFCSAPMCDAFLTLAYTEAGFSCFFVPRWKPDGTRNPFFIQRLKDKLGNRANASSEIEYAGTWARMLGEEGRGVRTIIEMVHHTRLDCALSSAAIMRNAVAHALHHAAHRTAFQKKLIDQPAMQRVLADMALETEAATTLLMRIAGAFDRGERDEGERMFARIAVACAKYWICKRTPWIVAEALECHGGNGYVETGLLARLYREAPLNGIWEGSGNVLALDVMRAIAREPESLELLLAEARAGAGADARFDAYLAEEVEPLLASRDDVEANARRLAQALTLALQASLLLRHAPAAVADAFCASRLDGAPSLTFGTLPNGLDERAVVERARPSSTE